MLRTGALVLSIAVLSGCVSTEHIPMTADTREAVRGRELAITTRERPDFGAMTPSRAVGGMIGGAIMISEGNALVSRHNLQDPADLIARALAEDLREVYGVRLAAASQRIAGDDAVQTARSLPGADLLLDIRTINWSYAYYPASWNRYRVIYSARLRVIDAKRAQVIAEGLCARVPDEAADAPSHDELLADDAARLKHELRSAAAFCVDQYRGAAFQLTGRKPASFAAAAPVTLAPGVPGPTATLATATPDFATPIPAGFLVVLPGTDVAPAVAAFSGAWSGKWAQRLDTTLIVEKIDGRSVSLIYSWGTSPQIPKPGYWRGSGAVDEEGVLRTAMPNGAKIAFRLSGDRSMLSGEYELNGRVTLGSLDRRGLR